MDDDRVTSVRGDQLTVKDHGKIRIDRRLAPRDVDHVERLANEVVGVTMYEPAHEKAVDGGITTIEIAGDKTKRIELWAGEDAPEPVWALLQCNRRAGSGRRVVAVLTVPGKHGGQGELGMRLVTGNLILYPQRDSNPPCEDHVDRSERSF